jgi:hypothetical protein
MATIVSGTSSRPGDHHDGVQGQEARVLDVPAGQHRTWFSRPDPLADPGHDDQPHQQRSGQLGPACREHGPEAALAEQPADGNPQQQDRDPGQDERGRVQAPPQAHWYLDLPDGHPELPPLVPLPNITERRRNWFTASSRRAERPDGRTTLRIAGRRSGTLTLPGTQAGLESVRRRLRKAGCGVNRGGLR